ncbi:unnamed protein product [Soboliphyme baturini]|uniref:DOMON domain-containing protein n=1 Tax=Soboliphyme baturini TaxID=241478 RepID=A0A183J4R1_9BILA|nr:unnamed protein product [Soboliphyme baturini]
MWKESPPYCDCRLPKLRIENVGSSLWRVYVHDSKGEPVIEEDDEKEVELSISLKYRLMNGYEMASGLVFYQNEGTANEADGIAVCEQGMILATADCVHTIP